ncbi:MAG: hypothetical protein ACXWAC_09845 [Usitatibacter sp.]
MAGEKDIFGKADALLRRHSVGSPATGSDTGGVPVLTDLVNGGVPAPVAAAPAPDPVAELARDVYARVMAEVEGRLAVELERRLAQHLVPQVHAAVASAIGDLHQELANAIGDAVAAAIAHRSAK